MTEKKYSAGLVSQRFWFYETKQYIEMLNEGKTDIEIKQLSEEVNIFGAPSASRAKETYRTARRRINALGNEMQGLFPKLNLDNQKITTLISVLLLNDLMLEFMFEVYQGQLQKEILQLPSTDYKAFFSEKQRTNIIVSRWKPYTYHRLAGTYRNFLLESGLIRETKGVDIITPKVLDSHVLKWLQSINRLDIRKAITGGV